MNKQKLLVLSILVALTLPACNFFSFGQESSNSSINSQIIDEPSSEEETSSVLSSEEEKSSVAPKSSSISSSKASSSKASSSKAPSSSAKSSSSAIKSSSTAPSSSSKVSSSQSPSSSSSNTSVDTTSGFYNIKEFNSPVEIHTSAQKTYLSYNGDYSKMPESSYPDGKNHQSDSNPVNLTWDYKLPSGKTISNYKVTYGQKSDLSDGYTVSTTSKSINLNNPYLGKNYFKIAANFSDGTSDSTEIRSFDVDTTCPRNLTIGGMTNCRDMGGRVTEDGGIIKQGLIYRTSGNKYDYSTTITDAGKQEMLNHLKVKTEVNVADGTSYNLNLSGTKVVDLKMDYSGGSHHFSRNAESVKNFFNLLADSNNYPVFFHCRIGTDRTGLCANLLYGLLGVPLNEIYQDYLFSNFGKIGEKRYIGTKAGADNIQNYINEVNSLSGKTFKNKVYNTLLTIGVTRENLDKVISNLTEGTLAKDNDVGQVVATADKLTLNGVSLSKDTSDRNHPNNYVVLDSSSKSVSYSFTASKAYKGQVVAYLGNTDHSTSKKIASAISCKIDDASLAMKDQTYATAGMGNCSNRMNYYPVVLGEMDIAQGNHTITITGTSNTMNLGTLCIFDAASASNTGGSGSGEIGEDHTHNYVAQSPATNKNGKSVTTYLCDCGAKYIAIDFMNGYSSLNGTLSDGTTGKIGKTTVVSYDIPAKAGSAVALQFCIKLSTYSTDHEDHPFDASAYGIKVNGVSQSIALANGVTYKNLGITHDFGYFTFATFDIDNDMNVEIEFDHHNTEYRLLFGEQVRLVYSA